MIVKHGDKHDITWTVNGDLTGATVRLLARSQAGVTTELACTVTDAENGEITHTLTGSLEVGTYRVEVEVTKDGKVTTFPSDGYGTLTVQRDLG